MEKSKEKKLTPMPIALIWRKDQELANPGANEIRVVEEAVPCHISQRGEPCLAIHRCLLKAAKNTLGQSK